MQQRRSTTHITDELVVLLNARLENGKIGGGVYTKKVGPQEPPRVSPDRGLHV